MLDRDNTEPLAACVIRPTSFAKLLDILTEQECYGSLGPTETGPYKDGEPWNPFWV